VHPTLKELHVLESKGDQLRFGARVRSKKKNAMEIMCAIARSQALRALITVVMMCRSMGTGMGLTQLCGGPASCSRRVGVGVES
jgi:hypothetical protein